MAQSSKHIVFLHPDLGIGGAERLVIDAAVGLQNLGHKVTIFTSHCDPKHCFDEARNGLEYAAYNSNNLPLISYTGSLDVRVRGNTLIPPSILNRFSILCAILRQIHLVLQICLSSSELNELKPDVFFIDQLSACIPLLRLVSPNARILFYCHFPDKLLAQRQGPFKKLYRIPFDWLESWTTGGSDVIIVNSKFTRGIFADAFPGLAKRNPSVVYPCVDVEAPSSLTMNESEQIKPLWKGKKIFLSINRFERKKDVGLAIKSFARLSDQARNGARLVIAGL